MNNQRFSDTMATKKSVPYWLFAANSFVLALMVYLLIDEAGGGSEGWGAILRATACVSFTFFTLAFSASSLVRLQPTTLYYWLLRNRRYLGLNFALSHAVHFVAIVMYFSVSDEAAGSFLILLGGLGYVFVAAMAATSTDDAVRRLGPKRWKLLHTLGGYYIWGVFLYTYASSALEKEWGYWIPVGASAGVLCVRLLAARRKGKPL